MCGVAACAPAAPKPSSAPVITGGRAIIEPALPAARLRIIATNDFHGALEARPDATGALRGGAEYLAGAIAKAEAECRLPDCLSILLDAGDQFQGTPASNLAHGRPVIDLFNQLGLSAAAVGNHEFDWTQDTLRVLMRLAHYPMMAANVRYTDGKDVPWIPNDTMLRRGPITVGVIGIATVDTPISTMPANVADLRFVDPVPIIDSIAPALRARGAQVVIVVTHEGGNCSASGCQGEVLSVASRLTSRVDAIISGHSHTFINTMVNGIPVVQARSRGQAIDVVDLAVGPTPAVLLHEVREVYTDSIKPDSTVARMTRAALAGVAPIVNRPIATLAEPMRNDGRQNALGNFIADAMRAIGGGDIGMMNNGGIRQSLQAGPATYGSLFEVQPFANTLQRVKVKGSDLRAYFARVLEKPPNFHVSGAQVVYQTGPMHGIVSITVGGKPVNDDAIYTVIQSNFTSSGGDGLGFGSAAISTEAVGITDLDALIQYLQSLPQPVKAPGEARLILRQ